MSSTPGTSQHPITDDAASLAGGECHAVTGGGAASSHEPRARVIWARGAAIRTAPPRARGARRNDHGESPLLQNVSNAMPRDGARETHESYTELK